MAGEESISFGISLIDLKATAAVFAIALLVIKLMTAVNKKRYKLPPGPRGLPIVGYLPFFGPEPPVTFTQMRKMYGDVISITMGSWPAIVINGRDAIMEALVIKGDDFSGRPAFTTARLLNNGRSLGFASFGPIWKVHRKIVSNVLYTFSNARKNPIEDIIRSDAKIVIREFLSHGDKSFCPLNSLKVAASSMVYQLCYGRQDNIRDDKDFMGFVNGMREFTEFTGTGNPVDVMPWLRYVMPSKVSKFLELIHVSIKCRCKKVEEHESTFDATNLRDITDGVIHAGNNLSEGEKAVGLDKRWVIESLDSIFGAGVNTVSTVLEWFVGLMAAYPDVQQTLFQQIDTVVGQGRDATLADRADLPLVEATLYEVLRYTSSLPFTLPHMTTCDTTLQGYDIPQGTVVLVNLYSIYMDEKLWGDPNTFRPERFLDTEGHLDRGLVEQVSAFSLGRRRCVGEFLARMEMFLFCTTLIQHLKFYKPPGQPENVLKARFGLTRDLKPFEVRVSQRD